MAAHNEVNGIPCHMDKRLLTDVLRDDYDFAGFYVSDWLDIHQLKHFITWLVILKKHVILPSKLEWI